MKNSMPMFCMSLFLTLALFLSCAGTAPANDAEPKTTDGGAVLSDTVLSETAFSDIEFSDIEGKDWLLSEITSAGKNVAIDRKKYEANFMGAYFTISFREGQVGGTGAPNRYFGPYTLEGGNGLRFGNVASTLMAAFIVPEELNESEYFSFLSAVTRWDLADGELHLYSTNSDGSEAILGFIPK